MIIPAKMSWWNALEVDEGEDAEDMDEHLQFCFLFNSMQC